VSTPVPTQAVTPPDTGPDTGPAGAGSSPTPRGPRETRINVFQWAEIDDDLRLELVGGRLERMPDVPLWHDILLPLLTELLVAHARTHGLGVIVASNGKIRMGRFRGRKPDLFFIPAAMCHLVGRNLFHGVPPLVVEVVSPGKANEVRDRRVKRREYAKFGIAEYWLVDFPNRRIDVLRLQDGRYVEAETVTGDAVWRPAMFPGLEIPLARLWPVEYENPGLD
jgi:Uma2 family endonuclease